MSTPLQFLERHLVNTTHGMTGTPEHNAWRAMKNRCASTRPDARAKYLDRGIRVCERWVNSFENFYADMGPHPGNGRRFTVERIDNDRGYEPGNVRWATPREQARNRRSTRWVDYQGKRLAIRDAIEASGTPVLYGTVVSRVSKGWSFEEAISTPVDSGWRRGLPQRAPRPRLG